MENKKVKLYIEYLLEQNKYMLSTIYRLKQRIDTLENMYDNDSKKDKGKCVPMRFGQKVNDIGK